MVDSAPSLSFVPTSLDYGTINVGSSCAIKSYHIKNKTGAYASAVNMSISFLGSVNASEAKGESWVYYSTATEADQVGSVGGGSAECQCPSVVQANSVIVQTKVIIPVGAATSGTVYFKAHHRYQYTG